MINSRTWYRVAALAMATGVAIASSWPSLSVSALGWSFEDKLQHMIAYSLLAYLAFRGWAPAAGRRAAPWIVLLILACFAAADEFHQRWIPGRFVEWGDFLADSIGVVAGFLVAAWQNRRRAMRTRAGTVHAIR